MSIINGYDNAERRKALIWQGCNFTLNRKMVNEAFSERAREVAYNSWRQVGVCKAKRRKVVQREEKIKSLQHELTTGERNIDSYISAIRHCIVAFDF